MEELTRAGRIASPGGPVVTRPLPLGPLGRTYGDRVAAIGDAAGLVKPTTGGGIYYSLLSAGWAAETVSEAFARRDFSSRALGAYEERWRARLGRELAVGILFRRLAGLFTPGDLDALTQLAIGDGLMPLVEAHARFNWHGELILEALRGDPLTLPLSPEGRGEWSPSPSPPKGERGVESRGRGEWSSSP